jgi:hypothetical protein
MGRRKNVSSILFFGVIAIFAGVMWLATSHPAILIVFFILIAVGVIVFFIKNTEHPSRDDNGCNSSLMPSDSRKRTERDSHRNDRNTVIAATVAIAVFLIGGAIAGTHIRSAHFKKYTFVNNSSFTVIIVPEYGDGFPVQPGITVTKSFESEHSNMELRYTPSDYVESKATGENYYEFHDKNFYFEQTGGFLIYPPDEWEIFKWPELQYKILVGQPDNNFAPNIHFRDFPRELSIDWPDYVDIAIYGFRGNGAKIISREIFSTSSNYEGVRIETNTDRLLQVYYLFPKEHQTVLVIGCSASFQSETNYAQIFDDCIKTLSFIP